MKKIIIGSIVVAILGIIWHFLPDTTKLALTSFNYLSSINSGGFVNTVVKIFVGIIAILLIWFLQSKKLWKPVILLAGLASLIWLGWIWHNMPSKPKPVVEFPGDVPGEVPMSFDGKKFMVVYPNQVVIVNTEGRIRVRQEGFDILDDLPQHRIEFPQGRIWCKVTSEEADSISKGSKYLDAWNSKEKAEVFRPKSGNAIVGYRVRGSEPKKLAIFVPLNKD